MPKIDTATLTIDAGNFYKAATATAIPTDFTVAPAAPWDDLGHTSLDTPFSITSEGGEATTIGTLQNRSLKTRYSTRQDTFGLILQQWDEASLKLFFGSNMEAVAEGLLGVVDRPTPAVGAFLSIFLDAEKVFAIYAPKAEYFRSDDPTFAADEALSGLPISVKPVKHGTNKWLYAVTPLEDLDI